MKKKNVLALALAAGLIFSGTAYAAENEPVPNPDNETIEGIEGEEDKENKGIDPTDPSKFDMYGGGAGNSQSKDKTKEEKPKAENKVEGYDTEAEADAAGKAATTKAMPYYEVYLQYGKYNYRLLNAPSKEQEQHDAIYKQQPKALAEEKFNPDQGYATFEEAQKAAEAIIAKSDINKGYNITKGKDGKYYIELTIDAKKTKDLDRKEIKEEAKEVKANNNNNVQTGVAGLTGVVATLAAASTALFKSKRK